uniref:Uncharacterized protein n=1 Tax=Anopheles farauti TaxID=69004 RepID=A0A182QBF6_9DIPT
MVMVSRLNRRWIARIERHGRLAFRAVPGSQAIDLHQGSSSSATSPAKAGSDRFLFLSPLMEARKKTTRFGILYFVFSDILVVKWMIVSHIYRIAIVPAWPIVDHSSSFWAFEAMLCCSVFILCITEFRLLTDVNTTEEIIRIVSYLVCLSLKVHQATAFINYPDMDIKTRKLLIAFQQYTNKGILCTAKKVFYIELSMPTFIARPVKRSGYRQSPGDLRLAHRGRGRIVKPIESRTNLSMG